MSKPLRLEFPGTVYHGTSRGDRRGHRTDRYQDLPFAPSRSIASRAVLWGQVLRVASILSMTSRAVTMAMPWWVPMGSICLRSPVTINSVRAATAAAIT